MKGLLGTATLKLSWTVLPSFVFLLSPPFASAFASTVAIKVGAFSTIKRSSMATARVLRFLFFSDLKTLLVFLPVSQSNRTKTGIPSQPRSEMICLKKKNEDEQSKK